MGNDKVTNDKPIRPETQALSDAIMQYRYSRAEAARDALLARNKVLELLDILMDEGKLDAMDAAAICEELLRDAAGADTSRKVHTWLRDLGKKIGERTPSAPVYDAEYIELMGLVVPVRLGPSHPRR